MQSLKRVLMYGIFLTLTLFLMMPVWASGVFIVEINGKTSDFEIKRDKKSIKFAHYTRLQVGDQVRVLTRTNDPHSGKFEGEPYFITLSINGKPKKLTQQNPDYQVTKYDIVMPGGVPTGIMNVVSGWFKRLWKYDVVMVQLKTKAPKKGQLAMPLLEGVNVNLIAGERPLYLGWYQGKPPYNVKVFCKDRFCKKGPFFEKTVQNNEVALKIRPFWAGQRYEVVVSDAEGTVIKSAFTVVAKTQSVLSKSEAQNIVKSNFSPKEKKTLLAAWLASKGQEWKLEAYQQVANATRETNASAFLLKQGLKAGITATSKK